MTLNNDIVLDRMNSYLDSEGFRKERIAKRLGKSPSAFYAHLRGDHPKTTYQFAIELATVLGLSPTFFIKENFQYYSSQYNKFDQMNNIAFSAGELSEQGKEGLEQIVKVCDLVEIYNN